MKIFSTRRSFTESERELRRAQLAETYQLFLEKVAEGRGFDSPEAVDAVARGRVWTGRQALEQGLVDELGGFDRALLAAKELAKLEESKARSDALVALEKKAMNAVRGTFDDGSGTYAIKGEPDPEMARQIMYGEEYHAAKAAIMQPVNEFLSMLDARTVREVQDLRQRGNTLARVLIGLAAVALAFAMYALLVLNRRVIVPVRRLARATEFVKEGQYRKCVEHASP